MERIPVSIVFIVDVYLLNTMSAISIHVMVRCMAAAIFPLFEGPVYNSLGINWSATLLAGLSAVIMLSSILFMIYEELESFSRRGHIEPPTNLGERV